ncbi:MAG: hypothetical protein MZV70_44645 [Desulfobacterales bacterium]|nr:hypothetical protein [Desulfobacterales bacterium]
MQQNRFQIGTAEENPNGILLLVNVEEGSMEMAEGRLRVEIEEKISELVNDPIVLLYEHPEEPSYAVIDDGDTNQMLIYLPSTTMGEVTVEKG